MYQPASLRRPTHLDGTKLLSSYLCFVFLFRSSLRAGGDAPYSRYDERKTQYLAHIHRQSCLESHLNLLGVFHEETEGEDEGKAWTYHKGWKAPQCAGVIHTDFEKGFIRAEVIKYDDYIKYGSEAAVREAGKLGIEGKEYVVQDGDIMHFRFNV